MFSLFTLQGLCRQIDIISIPINGAQIIVFCLIYIRIGDKHVVMAGTGCCWLGRR